MKKIILSIILFVSTYTISQGHIDHYKNYNYLEYELFRNNKLIGYHKYNFIKDDKKLSVISKVEFKITKLNIDLYNYFAESKETYENGKFINFESKTKQNKKDKYVNISLDKKKNSLLIDGSSYKGPTDIENIIGTWWNHEIVKAKAQISAISGRVIEQTVTFVGKEDLIINGKTYKTLRFNFKSSDKNLPDSKKLNTDIWYEENTYLWLKAAFDKTGYWEYRLKKFD